MLRKYIECKISTSYASDASNDEKEEIECFKGEKGDANTIVLKSLLFWGEALYVNKAVRLPGSQSLAAQSGSSILYCSLGRMHSSRKIGPGLSNTI